MAGNMPMRSWLRPSLRYESVSTMPLARRTSRDAVGVDAVVEVDGADHAGTVGGIGDERGGPVALAGPAVEGGGRRRTATGRPGETTVAEHPVELGVEHDERGQGGGVVRLVLRGIVECDGEVE